MAKEIIVEKKRRRKNVIVVDYTDDKGNKVTEVWGTFRQVCRQHRLSFWTLTRNKFPFSHEQFSFRKIPFQRKLNA
jgi:hypothetical protein